MNRLLIFLSLIFFSTLVVAQSDGLPPNPEPGKCYVKCVSHDEFKPDVVKVLDKPKYKVLKVVPATFKWVVDSVLVKEETKKFIYHPAEYEWVEVPYIKKEEEKVLTVKPAEFGNNSERVKVFPETGGWEYSTYSECASDNPDDCRVLCYVEKDAQFVTVATQKLVADASTVESKKPEKKDAYKKQVIKKAAWVEEIKIPAVYSTIRRQVVDEPAKVIEEVIDEVYESVDVQILAKKGGISTWEEIDCGLVKPTKLDILWDLNSAKLREDAKAKISEVLLSLLTSKPNISIELASHTDSRGSDEYNKSLSQRRADAVKSYLISQGISARRVTSKGYGETRLKNNCSNGVNCSENMHQMNRRTEYRVLSN